MLKRLLYYQFETKYKLNKNRDRRKGLKLRRTGKLNFTYHGKPRLPLVVYLGIGVDEDYLLQLVYTGAGVDDTNIGYVCICVCV